MVCNKCKQEIKEAISKLKAEFEMLPVLAGMQGCSPDVKDIAEKFAKVAKKKVDLHFKNIQ